MSFPARAIPDHFLEKWQETTNVMASIFEVPAGLIMRVLPTEIEVLVSSHGEDNPYEADEKARLNTGLYCETVMATRTLLSVPNALQDPAWRNNPDVALNMISYLGVPLLWDEDEVFGTICVLDSKTRLYQRKYVNLLWEIKKSIEADFRVIEQQENLVVRNAELRQAIASQESDAQKLKQANAELNTALSRLTVMQAELLRAEKMAALGALVAGVSHELNTPIGNCLMAASTLHERAAEFSAGMDKGMTRGHMADFVQAVGTGATILMRSLGQAAELVDNFKQVAVDRSSVKRRSFLLTEVVDQALVDLRPALQQAGHTVALDIPADVMLDSYPGALSQVLSNLIDNALVHGFGERRGGLVAIGAVLHERDAICLTVSDNGIGIPAANLARVFDPFFTTSLGRGGSGLGLHIADNLVHSALHGTIAVDSPPGQGARFTLRFPRVAPQLATA